jgi:hypothetical protein
MIKNLSLSQGITVPGKSCELLVHVSEILLTSSSSIPDQIAYYIIR